MDVQAVTTLRKKLIEDEAFRAEFAKSPGDALRSIGIPYPEDVEHPPVDIAELEKEIAALKNEAGDDLDKLYDPDVVSIELKEGEELSDQDLEAVAGGRGTFRMSSRIRSRNFMSFTRTFGNFRNIGNMRDRMGPGTVYTISVCGTADW